MTFVKRDYSLAGPEGERARERGLVEASWYACDIPRNTMKQLMVRRNGPAIRDTLLWFALLIGTGVLAFVSWGTWWAILAFLLYGTVYTVGAISRWHEVSHGTVFKTAWLNEAMYQLTSFMILVQATLFRWSHVRHHTDTIIVGRDREILAERPPQWNTLLSNFFRVLAFHQAFLDTVKHSFGRMSAEEQALIPKSEHRKFFWEARIWLILIIGVIGWCIAIGSILPLMFIWLPSFYGHVFNWALVITQHGGLSEDVLDHRLNTRTFYTNPFIRFLYSNMNYHVEHHMFPMVPYYNLPKLHELMKDDCPPAYPSMWAAFKEGMTTIYRQRKDPTYTPVRPLPATANPFRVQPS